MSDFIATFVMSVDLLFYMFSSTKISEFSDIYGAQNEAYRMMEGRKVGKVVSLQRVMRSLMVEAPQNETFTLV